MIRALRKTGQRTGRFLSEALMWRASERQYAALAWGLVAGAVWIAIGPARDFGGALVILAGGYLLVVLAAISAIDARFGIIPNSLVAGLAAGGFIQAYIFGADLWWRGFEVALVFAAVVLFRACYRWLRGQDGLGLGDVKFLAAAVLWTGIEGIPGLLLIAVASALISLLILRAQGHELHARQAISFGPHLALGLWWMWVLGTTF